MVRKQQSLVVRAHSSLVYFLYLSYDYTVPVVPVVISSFYEYRALYVSCNTNQAVFTHGGATRHYTVD